MNKFQVPTTTSTSTKNTGVILPKSDSKQKLQGITAVVDTKFENLQWSLLDSVSQSSADTNQMHPERDGIQNINRYQQGANGQGRNSCCYT